jgi:hypothetical protein
MTGALSITVQDTCYITCPNTRIKVILHYLDEPWLGMSKYKVEGVIFWYNPAKDTIKSVRDVPSSDVLGHISGSWVSEIRYALPGSKDAHLLVDLRPLFPAQKTLPPEETQLSNESPRLWSAVSRAIREKDYTLASAIKTDIEQRQQQRASERERNGETWKPRFFTEAFAPNGKPELTEQGLDVIRGLGTEDYHLGESMMTA